MKKFKTLLILIILSMVLSGQIPWNDPPEYYDYENQNRSVEIILPPPQNFTATTLNANQVLLSWDEYWTDDFKVHYKNRFGYEAIPNRFSLYKQNLTDGGEVNAFVGVTWNENQYVDTDVVVGKKYLYQILASDLNYQTYGGLQRWSKRENTEVIVTVGQYQSSLSCPSNFSGYYNPNPPMIILKWDYVNDASSYTIFKSFVDSIIGDPTNDYWLYLSIPAGNVNEYFDSELLPYIGYVYTIISTNGNLQSNRTSPLAINSGTLSIEDEEYWEAVKEYEKDRKIGWVGCSVK